MTANNTIRIGELLIQSGLLNEEDLAQAMNIAGESGLPVGRVLIMSGLLAEHELHAGLQLQSLIKDGVLEIETALTALGAVSQRLVTVEDALKELGWTKRDTAATNKLGEILLEAGLVGREQLDDALKTSFETGLPLGSVLTVIGVLSESLLTSALNAQVLIRDGKVSREQAIQGLRAAKARSVSLEQSLQDQGLYRLPPRQSIRLGELLVLSGLLGESDLLYALELGLVNERPLGEVLVLSGFIPRQTLQAALRFQEMVTAGSLSAAQAAEALVQVHTRGVAIAQAVAEVGMLKPQPHEVVRLGELLTLAGIVNSQDIQKAVELSTKNSALIGKMLIVTGLIDESTLHASLRCQFLIREGFLRMDQAIIALNYCQRGQLSFDDALEELGWTPPRRHAQAASAEA